MKLWFWCWRGRLHAAEVVGYNHRWGYAEVIADDRTTWTVPLQQLRIGDA
ncbi:hypothetical protein [uncultured Citricoccus sp.]|nr:hypothetical protein [uncultured Citricoccus sp.]